MRLGQQGEQDLERLLPLQQRVEVGKYGGGLRVRQPLTDLQPVEVPADRVWV